MSCELPGAFGYIRSGSEESQGTADDPPPSPGQFDRLFQTQKRAEIEREEQEEEARLEVEKPLPPVLCPDPAAPYLEASFLRGVDINDGKAVKRVMRAILYHLKNETHHPGDYAAIDLTTEEERAVLMVMGSVRVYICRHWSLCDFMCRFVEGLSKTDEEATIIAHNFARYFQADFLANPGDFYMYDYGTRSKEFKAANAWFVETYGRVRSVKMLSSEAPGAFHPPVVSSKRAAIATGTMYNKTASTKKATDVDLGYDSDTTVLPDPDYFLLDDMEDDENVTDDIDQTANSDSELSEINTPSTPSPFKMHTKARKTPKSPSSRKQVQKRVNASASPVALEQQSQLPQNHPQRKASDSVADEQLPPRRRMSSRRKVTGDAAVITESSKQLQSKKQTKVLSEPETSIAQDQVQKPANTSIPAVAFDPLRSPKANKRKRKATDDVADKQLPPSMLNRENVTRDATDLIKSSAESPSKKRIRTLSGPEDPNVHNQVQDPVGNFVTTITFEPLPPLKEREKEKEKVNKRKPKATNEVADKQLPPTKKRQGKGNVTGAVDETTQSAPSPSKMRTRSRDAPKTVRFEPLPPPKEIQRKRKVANDEVANTQLPPIKKRTRKEKVTEGAVDEAMLPIIHPLKKSARARKASTTVASGPLPPPEENKRKRKAIDDVVADMPPLPKSLKITLKYSRPEQIAPAVLAAKKSKTAGVKRARKVETIKEAAKQMMPEKKRVKKEVDPDAKPEFIYNTRARTAIHGYQ